MRTTLVRNLCLVTMSTFLTLPALAANIVVTTTADEIAENGECSLREAVISANQDDGGDSGCTSGNGADVIVVPAGLYILDNSYCNEGFAFGDYDPAMCNSLDITDNTTIEGDPNGGTIIDGDNYNYYEAGIFFIHSPYDIMEEVVVEDEDYECVQGIEVTLRDMTVQNGSSMYGGGITLYSGGSEIYDKAILENMIVRNNDTGYGSNGYGGGIYSEGHLVVNNSQIIENGASNGYGGGLYSYNWRYYYDETCQFSSVITDTIIDNNKVEMMMDGNDGETQNGGEYYSYPIAYGGGVYNDEGELIFRSTADGVCSISGNEVYNHGGGIFNEHILTIEGCTLNNNIADFVLYEPEYPGYDGFGGAIYGDEEQYCDYGGADNLADEECVIANSITISDSTLSGNRAGYEGGGIAAYAHVYISRTSITENEAGWYSGGASFWGHYRYDYNDGQGLSYYIGDAHIEKTTIANNVSHAWAGGVYNYAEFRCVNSTISGNEAALGWGGGFIQDSSMDSVPAVFRNCTVTGNMVDHVAPDDLADFVKYEYEGSGMYACADNDDYLHGGGLYVESGNIKLSNTLVAGNIDGDACVFEDDGEGDVLLATDLVTAPDCWVYECNEPMAQIDEDENYICAAILSTGYNLVGTDQGCMYPAGMPGDKVGTVDSEIDPVLGPLSENGGTTRTHALMDESPALDSGNPSQLGGDADEACLIDDQRFEVRPEIGKPDGSERCDIGAYERLAERDCLENPWGVAVLDRCGICAGDGDSCLDCTDANIVAQQFSLDGGGLELKSIAHKTARKLRRLGKKRAAKKTRVEANELYNEMWNTSWALPSVVTSCANTEFCVEVSNASEINDYITDSDSLRSLVVDGVKMIRKAKGKNRAGRKLRKAANNQHETNLATAASVPSSSSVCS